MGISPPYLIPEPLGSYISKEQSNGLILGYQRQHLSM